MKYVFTVSGIILHVPVHFLSAHRGYNQRLLYLQYMFYTTHLLQSMVLCCVATYIANYANIVHECTCSCTLSDYRDLNGSNCHVTGTTTHQRASGLTRAAPTPNSEPDAKKGTSASLAMAFPSNVFPVPG